MLTELRNGIIDTFQANYNDHKPYLKDRPAYSAHFFEDWRNKGLFHAFNGLVGFVDTYEGVDNATLYSLETIARGFLQTLGIEAYPPFEPVFASTTGTTVYPLPNNIDNQVHYFEDPYASKSRPYIDGNHWVVQKKEGEIYLYNDPDTTTGLTHEQAEKKASELDEKEIKPW